MKSEITVRTQGVKGGNAKFTNVGCTTIYATDKGQTRNDLVIDLDSFVGSGRTYKRRDNTLINITFEGQDVFNGTIQQLVAKLNPLAFYSGKALQIKKIKDTIEKWGSTTSGELGLESSPCINSIDSGKHGVVQLIEYFNADGVTAVTYDDEIELDSDDINYEDLSDDLIDEIENIMENYDVDMEKTEKRCQ